MKQKNIYFYSNLLAWGLVLFLIGNYVFAWVTPTSNPPEGDLSAPLDTSSTAQTKTGDLTIDGLFRVGRYSSAPTGATGALYYDTTENEFKGYKASSWDSLGGGGASPAGSTGYIQFNDSGALGADSNLFWDNENKQLGIGTTTPGAKLEVEGLIKFNNNYENTALGYYSLYPNTSGYDNTAVGFTSLNNNTTGASNVAVGDETLHNNIDGSGNTAIGSTVLYRSTSSDFNTAVGTYSLHNTTGNNNIAIGYQAGYNLDTGNNNIIIGYNIDLPTTSSSNMLDIGNLIYATGLDGSGTTISTGNVGIGTTSPGYKLDVNGDVAATAFYYSSDERLKENVQKIETPLEKIMKLEGISFNWKDSDKKSIGLIAQDVEKVFPEIVKTDENSGMKSIEYGNLVAPLIEAIKEQQKMIDEQREIINKQGEEIKMLKDLFR